MTTPLLRLTQLVLLAGGAWAQGLIQNSDLAVLGGVMRRWAGNLWIEFWPATFAGWGRYSVVAEWRDFVTGRGLSGVPGRQHIAPQMRIVWHF